MSKRVKLGKLCSVLVTRKLVKLQVEAALTDSETLEEVIECLSEHLKIETQGACDQRTLFNMQVESSQ